MPVITTRRFGSCERTNVMIIGCVLWRTMQIRECRITRRPQRRRESKTRNFRLCVFASPRTLRCPPHWQLPKVENKGVRFTYFFVTLLFERFLFARKNQGHSAPFL